MKTRREFIKTSGFLIASVSAISLEDLGATRWPPLQGGQGLPVRIPIPIFASSTRGS